MPGGHELGHHGLGADFRMAHIYRAAAGERIDQARRQHQVAQAQGRERDFAERADIKHTALAIQCRQGRQGRTAVAVLAVVVILDDPTIVAFSPGQQLQPPREAHDHAGRVLMGRRDVGQPAVAQRTKRRAIKAIAIDRYTPHLGTGHGKRMPGGAVAGIFHRHDVAGVHQQLCTKADALLRAAGDHNLFSGAVQATGAAQVSRDQAAQARVTLRVAITQLLQIRLAPKSRIQLGPDVERE